MFEAASEQKQLVTARAVISNVLIRKTIRIIHYCVAMVLTLVLFTLFPPSPLLPLPTTHTHTNFSVISSTSGQFHSCNCKIYTLCVWRWGRGIYWMVQVGLLTPLTFARHRLSPLDAFTSSAYFFQNGRQ